MLPPRQSPTGTAEDRLRKGTCQSQTGPQRMPAILSHGCHCVLVLGVWEAFHYLPYSQGKEPSLPSLVINFKSTILGKEMKI